MRIDEVLRGTNTVERIAASTEILAAMHDKGNNICIAATHDVELCSLLAGKYVLFHFDEKITDGKMVF
jgi:DNA mismatch repair ATPase MutS